MKNYNEAEIPGREVTQEQFNMICCRYFSALPFIENKTVLEVGCGAGLGLGILAKHSKRVIGGDINKNLLTMVNKHYKNKIKTKAFNAHVSPYNNNSFDVILCMEVLQYLSIDIFLSECHRVLKNNEKLIICIPNKDNVDFKPSSQSCNYFSVQELNKKFTEHGFKPEIYGAFESSHSKQRNIKQKICEFGSTILNYLPSGDIIKSKLNKNILNKVVLPNEITEQLNPELLKLSPLNSKDINTKHKIIYIIADVIK